MKVFPKSLLLVVFLLIFNNNFAQSDRYSNSIGVLFDQDVLAEVIGLNEDRNYTQGLGVNWTSRWLKKQFDKKFRLKDPSDNVLNFPTTVTIQLGGFTPDELRDTLPIIGDRPYSSVIFFSLKDFRVDQEKFRARYWGFYVGMLGIPNVAKNAQTAIHKPVNQNNTIPPYNPAGWHNQISHGGEPTAMMSYGVKKLLTKHAIKLEMNRGREKRARGIRTQIISNWQIDLGYLTQFTFGADIKLGAINLKKWHTDNQWALSATSSLAEASNLKERTKVYFDSIQNNNEFYLFAGMRAGVLAYNASLHGQFRTTNYRLAYEDTGFFTNTGRIGLGISRKHLNLTIYGAYKTSEMITEYARTHYWGGFTVNWNWLN